MIKKHGQIIISEEGIKFIGFHIDSSDGILPILDVLNWAKEKIAEKEIESEKFHRNAVIAS